MKRPECKIAILRLAGEWAETEGKQSDGPPSFGAFKSWLKENGNGQYLEFRSRMGAAHDTEQWFDDALKQGWRN